MSLLVQKYVLELPETSLVLLPSKLVWWSDQRTIFMADSHFGKASTFRKAGLAVPLGTTTKMLTVLSEHINKFSARTLIVLGDLLHSNVRAQDDFEKELANWRSQHQQLKFVLVKGNHDRIARSFYDRLAIEVESGVATRLGPFELCHDPEDATGNSFSMCGHIHPAIRLAGDKLCCYWLRQNQLVLPAFGEFTGTASIELAAQEKAIAICEDNLAVLSSDIA